MGSSLTLPVKLHLNFFPQHTTHNTCCRSCAQYWEYEDRYNFCQESKDVSFCMVILEMKKNLFCSFTGIEMRCPNIGSVFVGIGNMETGTLFVR